MTTHMSHPSPPPFSLCSELEHVPPSDKPFKTLYFFLARLRKPALECRVKGLNGAFMAKIVDMGALSKTGCVWMKNAALLNIGTTFHAVKPGIDSCLCACGFRENKAGYTTIQSRTVGQEQ